ncbi:hypothetical protein [Winogradskyella sp.]|uniref:hypothetical protein n=1 Tax=Winogradskyella sp. TaxID=1883156 RepID=UPI002622BD9F|nr:hypothetical protein [Winogradskyella sp.]
MYLKINNSICLLLLIVSFGCKQYHVTDEVKRWQPYKKGDLIVFQSSKGELDSIFIKGVESSFLADDNLSISPDKHENITVTGEIILDEPIINSLGQIIKGEEISVLNIYADERTYFNFEYNKPSDSLNYPSTSLSFEDLKSLFNNKTINNDVVIDAVHQYDSPIIYDLKRIWWNKKFGYTKFEFNNGYSLSLIKFVRDKEDIFRQ